MVNPVEIILRKRSGETLSYTDLKDFVEGFLSGAVEPAQMSALLMAIYFRGMTGEEIQTLTEVYVESGDRVTFPAEWRTVDKHSTGGVGDKISLPLAAIVAACGARIPMISGRGLGHTGGTLDKLEAIPGFRTNYEEADFRRMIEQNGLAIISQSKRLAPADGKIYALRDITATVESLPLITASIMSKKIVEGAQNLVIDLKVGSGAFMKTLDDAHKLARLLTGVGNRLGQRVTVVFTDMESPIGKYAGNALEVLESIEYLRGEKIPDLDGITRKLAVEMLLLAGIAIDETQAASQVEDAIVSGRALEAFRKFVEAQQGDPRVCDEPQRLAKSPACARIECPADGWIEAIDSQSIGYALVGIGAGRKTQESVLDYGAGAYLPVRIGEQVKKGEALGEVYAATPDMTESAAKRIAESYRIVPKPVAERPRILQTWRDGDIPAI
jgi:pyrimidine-nucleoside phosphorylase